VRSATFLIEAPPPTRHHPGRCADRTSPNALPLFQAVADHVAAEPDAFPIRDHVVVVLASAEPFASPEGYSIATAIEEVLVDAGFLADERLVGTERHEIRAEMTGYSVFVELSV
jgi:hypothetical protein